VSSALCLCVEKSIEELGNDGWDLR